ncbi:ACP S-malonyltransferase [Eubacterium sp.]|uniref:ACP S-malonyltransferase n=1 Tax=Eubacterium sp. TaxID=142586 RepID=UPI0025FCE11B|nr:ACP S-malonyltransferase [Eubacterium sp.]MCR5630006.1 ACP S-malonyltransferase [Eubacterium sp.]
MKIAFLYAGQGSQRVGMGKDFYEEFDSFKNHIDNLKDSDVIKIHMFEGPIEELSNTKNTQRAMAAYAGAVTDMLADEGIKPEVSMGLSLGEYGALYAAGAYDYENYVALTTFRGEKMSEAAAGKKCAMSAILGLSSEDVTKACEDYMKEHVDDSNEEIYVTVSNYNCTGQCVICGTQKAVEDMEGILKEKGAKRCVRVNVSGPFHTKYMKEAGDALESYFNEKPLNTPSLPVLLNATGDYYKDGDDLSKQLIKQVQSSVRLEENIEKLLDSDIDTFIEIGPGKVVSGFLKRMTKGIDRDIKLLNIDTVEDYKSVVEYVKNNK